jgi:hypothetical protein
MTDRDSQLDRYETELEHLRAENDQLRRSAEAFGELAERLNRALIMASATVPALEIYSPPPAICHASQSHERSETAARLQFEGFAEFVGSGD